MIIYQEITAKDHHQMEELRDYSFRYPYKGNFLKDFQNWLNWSHNLGAFSEDKLKGQVMILPLTMMIHGVPYQMGGIGNVGVYPENRGQGITKQLLIQSLQTMRDNGQYVSVLSPFAISYYRQFGWEVFFDQLDYTIPFHQFPKIPKQNNHYIRFDFQDKAHLSVVKRLHNKYAHENNGIILRDDKWWERLSLRESDSVFCLYMDEQATPKGFLRYIIDDTTFIIKDFITFDYKADLALWQYIVRHQSNVFTIKGSTTAHQSFGIEFNNPQFQKEIIHQAMIRIVDMQKFLEVYAFRHLATTLYIRIHDLQAEWNNQTFAIHKNGAIEPLGTKIPEQTIETDINTLSALFAGYQRVSYYTYYNRITGDREQLQQLDNAIPHQKPQMYADF